MKTTHLEDDDLVLQYYGELGADGPDADSHLRACAECQVRYVRLQRVMAAVDTLGAPSLSEGLERTVWARLEPELTPRRGPFARLLLAPANLAWAAMIVLLVAGAFVAGRMSREQVAAPGSVSAQQIQETILLAELTEHLNRSQAMLVELVSEAPPADAPIDISLERDRAEELVAANRLYRQTAVWAGEVSLGSVLDELERLLVELAASPDQLSPDEMDRVQQRIAAKDLLFKLRVVTSSVRERQKTQIRARAGQSS